MGCFNLLNRSLLQLLLTVTSLRQILITDEASVLHITGARTKEVTLVGAQNHSFARLLLLEDMFILGSKCVAL